MFRIVADSAANLHSFSGASFVCAPLKIIEGKIEYVDNEQLDTQKMLESLRHTHEKVSTSCPNAGEWLAAFEGADSIFAITISSQLSGSYAAASLAAEEYMHAHPEARVTVVDSLSCSGEMTLWVEALARWSSQGLSHDEMDARLQDYRKHTHLLFSLESFTNLARAGRVKPTVAALAGLLGIRVLSQASREGTVEPIGKYRGESKVLKALCEELAHTGYLGGRVWIHHVENPGAAQTVRAYILDRFPQA